VSDLAHFVEPIKGFADKPAPFKVEVFAWYLHEVKQKERFQGADIGPCFDETHTPRPPNIPTVLTRLCEKRPARLIKDPRGYRLSAPARAEMTQLLPVRATSVKTTQLLNGLLDRVTDPAQKAVLAETLACFKHHAYRAAIVMAWNLAFSEVLDRIFVKHLVEFNAQLPKVLPKASLIAKRADFEDLKESKIIEIAKGAGILSGSTAKILTEKLNKRNTAAHPSVVTVLAVTAEEVIADLVENVILRATW
jgi:hypothetical protein